MPVLRSLMAATRAIKDTDAPWDSILSDTTSATGKRVTPISSLRMSAVYAAVRLLAESVSSLPASLILRDGNRRRTQDGPLADLLTVQPNPEQDAPELWRTVMGWMLLEGNAYVYVERDGAGTPIGLWPLPATDVTVGRTPRRRLYYELRLTGADLAGPIPDGMARLGPEQVLHYKAFGVGLYGLSPIRQVREAVATSLSAQEYMARFYQQDASPGGVIQVPDGLSDEAFDRLKKQWRETHGGTKRAHMLAILEHGAKWEKVGLSPQDAEFINTQKWETTEIARAFGVPPHMIGDVERSTSWGSGIAEQGIGFVTYTLTPWITRLEWVARRGLLADLDRRLRLKWRVEGLQRGDAKSRYEAYAIGRQWGWLSTNDVRTLEDQEPVPGGDVYLQPLNMVEAGVAGPADDPDRTARRRGVRSREARRRIAEAFVPLIEEADRAIAKIERQEVGALVDAHLGDRSRSPAQFGQAVEELYDGTIRQRAIDRWTPVFTAFATEVARDAAEESGGEPPDLDRWVQTYVASHVGYRVGRAVSKIRSDAAKDNAPDAIRSRLDSWVEERPAKTARWESTQASRATARETWRSSGIRELLWVTAGDSCPYCLELDGKVVGIEEPFMREGDSIEDSEQGPLTAGRNTYHPPMHPGCDCDLAPA